MRAAHTAGFFLACALTLPAQAQSVEDRLREALRKQTVDLRAAQDSLGVLQTQLDQTVKQRDALQQKVDELTAKTGEQQAAPAASPAIAAPPPLPSEVVAEINDLREAVKRQQAQIGQLQAGLAKWQSAYQEAASVARAKDAESRALSQTVRQAQSAIGMSRAENTKLAALANEILHMYQTQDFRRILIGSYEPFLGLKKVELENIVQDYEDKIRDLHLPPQAAEPAAAPAGRGAKR